VASLVWSYDRFAARYEAMMLIQHPRQKQIDELRKLVYVRSLLSYLYVVPVCMGLDLTAVYQDIDEVRCI
jgi:hypothetical protein